MSIIYKFCNNDVVVKNGVVYGKQRYKCKACNRNFRLEDKREKYNEEVKLKVIKLYLENCGIRSNRKVNWYL